jgi:hypothetical protein
VDHLDQFSLGAIHPSSTKEQTSAAESAEIAESQNFLRDPQAGSAGDAATAAIALPDFLTS